MLFNSYTFVLAFLPALLLLHLALTRHGSRAAVLAALIAASIVFYVSWQWQLAWAMVASIAFNLLWSRLIRKHAGRPLQRVLLYTGVIANVAWLAMFKIAAWPQCDHWIFCGGFRSAEDILVPLGISFITFQQIIFLVDTARERIAAPSALEHLFIALFFPHLVMGPLVHVRSMLPQLRAPAFMSPAASDLALGLTLFAVGLFKKVVLAESLAVHVNPVFDSAAAGTPLNALDAWVAAAAFPMQLYFDFCGYADMAVGIARMFGIVLPFSFDSPLKAVDRLDLWRRWNTTLTDFFRTYVFLPLCRLGVPHVLALLATGMLSGLWHGFGPTFLLWSLALTVMMLASHTLKQRPFFNYAPASNRPHYRKVHIALTFLVTMLLSVLFRAPHLDAARNMYAAMAGAGEAAVSVLSPTRVALIACCAGIAWGMPNIQTLLGNALRATKTGTESPGPITARLAFDYGRGWATAVALMMLASLLLLDRSGRFVYMQF